MRDRGSRVLLLAVLVVAIGCRGERAAAGIAASGHVEATEVRVSTKIAGRLVSFAVHEGDRLEAGQMLGRVDTTDLELALRQADAERDLADAELRLRRAGTRKEEIAQHEAETVRAAADLDGAEKDLVRMQALLERGSGTTKARDDAVTRRDVAAARLEAARQALVSARAGSRPEEIDAARARLEGAEARLAQLRQQIVDATIVSPVAGVLTEKVAEQGELLAVGSPLAVVTNLEDAWLTVYVGEPDLARVRLGQVAQVRTDDGTRREGKVTFVASRAEFTPKNVQTRDERVKLVFKVKIGLDNRDGLFKPGMPAEAVL